MLRSNEPRQDFPSRAKISKQKARITEAHSLRDLKDSRYQRFLSSIRSPMTRKASDIYLHKFMDHFLMDSFDRLFSTPAEDQARLEHYVQHIRNRHYQPVRAGSASNYINALVHFYWINNRHDKKIDWDVVRSFKGEHIKAIKDRPYSREEVRRALDKADVREKVAILLESTAAVRVGGLPGLVVENLEERKHPGTGQKMYKITVYRNTPDEYFTFCTPETAGAIDDLFSYRLRMGEACSQYRKDHHHGQLFFPADHQHLDPRAPVIREQFDKRDQFAIKRPKHLSKRTIMGLIDETFIEAGVRSREKGGKYNRKEVMLTHGLRKFCRQQMRRAKVDAIIIEYLLGHDSGDPRAGVTKLMMTYDPEDEPEVFAEYCKAVDSLTIYDEHRLKAELKEKDRKLKSVESELYVRMGELEQQNKVILDFLARHPGLMLKTFKDMHKAG